jgi:hypothetical protein
MKLLIPVVLACTCGLGSLVAQTSRPSSRPSADARSGQPDKSDKSDEPAKSAAQAHDKPERARNGGYLGIFFEEVLLGRQTALHIRSVQKDSDAARLGFRADDQIVAVDGRQFRNGDEFIKALWYQSQRRGKRDPNPAVKHSVTVLRGGKETVLDAGLADLDRSPAVGQPAPDFTLRGVDGKTVWNLKQKLAGGKPVVLVFGSYT